MLNECLDKHYTNYPSCLTKNAHEAMCLYFEFSKYGTGKPILVNPMNIYCRNFNLPKILVHKMFVARLAD